MLTIWIDFKSPGSYLAFEPVLAMLAETGAEARWLPFSDQPFTVPVEKPEESVGDRHRRVRAEAMRATHLRYAEALGHLMRFTDDPAGSDTALAAMASLADPVPFMRAACSAYWVESRDLDDEDTVAELCVASGAGSPDFHAGHKRLTALREEAAATGIFGTPSFVIGDHIFVGREHLPWIRTLLTG